jgi:DNA-binding response OmpR family regulator
MKALIVDDDRVLADVVAFTLRREGFEVIKAYDGRSAVQHDYIVKPFSPRQLVARTKAVLRRAGKAAAAPIHQAGDLSFDRSRREVTIGDGDAVSLTQLENRLFECLIVNVGHVLTTDVIIDHVWGPSGGDRDMLRQLVRRLRGKIEPDPTNPTYIKTIPGLGYGLVIKRDIS